MYRFYRASALRPGMSKAFLIKFNIYGAEELLKRLKRGRKLPPRTKTPVQPVVYQPRFFNG